MSAIAVRGLNFIQLVVLRSGGDDVGRRLWLYVLLVRRMCHGITWLHGAEPATLIMSRNDVCRWYARKWSSQGGTTFQPRKAKPRGERVRAACTPPLSPAPAELGQDMHYAEPYLHRDPSLQNSRAYAHVCARFWRPEVTQSKANPFCLVPKLKEFMHCAVEHSCQTST